MQICEPGAGFMVRLDLRWRLPPKAVVVNSKLKITVAIIIVVRFMVRLLLRYGQNVSRSVHSAEVRRFVSANFTFFRLIPFSDKSCEYVEEKDLLEIRKAVISCISRHCFRPLRNIAR